jgi:hypothetical protein
VGLEDVGALRTHECSDLVETGEQVIRAVIRQSWSGHSNDTGTPLRRDPCVGRGNFISWPGRDHRVIVAEMA